jgi:hypothetical protein
MRVSRLIFLAMPIVAIIIVPLASADNLNVTQNNTPFITINPIGNHAVGDVFFINGTTNLGQWENTLDLDIEWWAFNPAGRWSSMYITNASIQPFGNGTGIWSAEVLPAQWKIYTDVEHRTTVFRDVNPGEYVAYAESTSPLGPTVISQQTFFIVPPETPGTPESSNTTAVPESGGTGIPAVPTRQNAPFPGYLTVIAVCAVTIYCISNREERNK